MAEKETILQFVPFVSKLEAGFWHELSQRKLEKYKLSEEARDIYGYYTNSEPLQEWEGPTCFSHCVNLIFCSSVLNNFAVH